MKSKLTYLPLVLLGLSLSSCNSAEPDWKRSDSLRVRLYSRPDGFSKGIRHSEKDIQVVLAEQERYIDEFEGRFRVVFDGIVTIYLYNTGEQDVGPSPGGGCADPSTGTIYYRFFPRSQNADGSVGVLGGHEIFHVMVGKTFGTVSSWLLGEGGAVWFDGGYSSEASGDGWRRKSIVRWMREFAGRGALLKPSVLAVDVGQIEEGTFYPQAGSVVTWIVESFGIEKYVELLKSSIASRALEAAVRDVYGMSLEDLNRLGSESGAENFSQWSDSKYGAERTRRFFDLVKKGNDGLLRSVLGMSMEDIDSRYLDWVREYAGRGA